MTPLYIFDLDGTLADLRHRLHHVRLLPGSKVKIGEAHGTYHGPNERVPGDYWIEFPGTGTWSFDPSDVKLVKDWDAFHAACADDKPIIPVTTLYRSLYTQWGADNVRIWSGRMDTVRDQTRDWLHAHVGYAGAATYLKMRPAGDYTPDDQLKESWLKALSPEDRARLAMVFDDRQRVVDMWRRNGIVCAQLAEGDF